jgi:hypothetical protein
MTQDKPPKRAPINFDVKGGSTLSNVEVAGNTSVGSGRLVDFSATDGSHIINVSVSKNAVVGPDDLQKMAQLNVSQEQMQLILQEVYEKGPAAAPSIVERIIGVGANVAQIASLAIQLLKGG